MSRPPSPLTWWPRALALRGTLLAVAVAAAAASSAGEPSAPEPGSTRLVARSILPASTFREGSPPSGAFFSPADRAAAARNGLAPASPSTYLPAQPVQGFSSMVPADATTWWALSDNGFAWRTNSADFQLAMYRIDPRWGDARGPRVLETVVLRDPDRHLPWTLACDPAHGSRLPDFDFNTLPTRSTACPEEASTRILTGFDLDPESFVRAPDGTFWIGEEFGPFLIHVSADGRVLEAPVAVPGVRSPQNPFLDLRDRARPERPSVAASRGFEGLAISPCGSRLYALLEGAVTGDDPQDLRIYVYDLAQRTFAPAFMRLRLELPSQTADLGALRDAAGRTVYPGAPPPTKGPVAIGELKAVNDHQLLVIERDNLGDDTSAPRFKKVFLLDLPGAGVKGAGGNGGYVGKTLLLDLLAIPDPFGLGQDGDFFRLPFYTLESVHVVDDRTLLVASDNNFPFSNGRARSRSPDRSGPLASDATEMILVRLGAPLGADPRLFPQEKR